MWSGGRFQDQRGGRPAGLIGQTGWRPGARWECWCRLAMPSSTAPIRRTTRRVISAHHCLTLIAPLNIVRAVNEPAGQRLCGLFRQVLPCQTAAQATAESQVSQGAARSALRIERRSRDAPRNLARNSTLPSLDTLPRFGRTVAEARRWARR